MRTTRTRVIWKAILVLKLWPANWIVEQKEKNAIEREKRKVVYGSVQWSIHEGKMYWMVTVMSFLALLICMLFISQSCIHGARSYGACLLRYATPTRRRHDGACAFQPLSPDCAVNYLHYHPSETELIIVTVKWCRTLAPRHPDKITANIAPTVSWAH